MDHLETLFDRALDAVVGMDEAGLVTAWNGAAEAMFGWSRAEALGAVMGELIVPPKHRLGHSEGLAHYIRTGEGPVLERRVRITSLRRDGAEFPVELSIFPMPSKTGVRTFYAFIRSLEAEEQTRYEQDMRRQEATALLSVAQKLLDDVTIEEFSRFCLRTVCEVAGFEAGHFLVPRGSGDEILLHPTGIWHLADPRFEPVAETTSSIRFRYGEGLPGHAWQTGRVEALDDITASQVFIRRDTFTQVGLVRGVAVPVFQGGQLQGVLEFFGSAAARSDPPLLQMLQTIGTQVGVAIRRKEAAEHRELLRREMSHRVGNSLTILAAIYRNCSRIAATKDDLDAAFLERVVAVGRANRIAVEDARDGAMLDSVIHEAIGLLPNRDQVEIDVPRFVVGSESVMPLALIFNELATNALKHNQAGDHQRIEVHAELDEASLRLVWSEPCQNLSLRQCESEQRIGFGTQLLKMMVESRLGGRIDRVSDRTGYHVTLVIPLEQIRGWTAARDDQDRGCNGDVGAELCSGSVS